MSKIKLEELELLDVTHNNDKTIIKVRCLVSKGTYIRALGNDIAKKLSSVAIMSNLRRTKQGKFTIEDSYKIEEILNEVDMVLVMSVNPGFGGQVLIDYCIEKIYDLKTILSIKNINADIEVDGGINISNVRDVLNAGANVIVAGSAVYNGDASLNVRKFLSIFDEK